MQWRGVPAHLFQLEDVLVEVLLQLLVGVVDAELLKRVLLEHLKPKDVQHSDGITLKKNPPKKHAGMSDLCSSKVKG